MPPVSSLPHCHGSPKCGEQFGTDLEIPVVSDIILPDEYVCLLKILLIQAFSTLQVKVLQAAAACNHDLQGWLKEIDTDYNEVRKATES